MRAGHQSTVGCCLRRDPQAVGFTARTRAEPVLLAKRMALGKMREFRARAFAIMLVVMAGSVARGPASAPYHGGRLSRGLGGCGWGGWGWGGRSSGGWGDRYPSDRYYRRSPHRDFLSPFSGARRNRPAPAVDYSKAPPPRKLETPPSQTVVVIGDSMADWLGY